MTFGARIAENGNACGPVPPATLPVESIAGAPSGSAGCGLTLVDGSEMLPELDLEHLFAARKALAARGKYHAFAGRAAALYRVSGDFLDNYQARHVHGPSLPQVEFSLKVSTPTESNQLVRGPEADFRSVRRLMICSSGRQRANRFKKEK